jgi:diguanylate cyclase (GGDEF)-like protein/PAS domain S-box-containing protein
MVSAEKPIQPANAADRLHLGADALLHKALTLTANAVFITNEYGHIIWINEAFSQLTGYSAEEALGSTPAILKSGKQSNAFYMEMWQTLLSGRVWRGMMVDRRKDNTLFNVDEVITPLLDEQGKITHLIAIQHDMTLRNQEDERIYYLAYHDPLTGLANRALFLEILRQAISAAERNRHMLAILYLDLDRFKQANDSLGHALGDQLLVAVAERMRSAVRKVDAIARLGGDEFVILLSELHGPEVAVSLAEKLLDTLSRRFVLGEHVVLIGASIGISIYPMDGKSSEALLVNTDKAMYMAKKNGGNKYCIHGTDSFSQQ